MTTPNDLTGSTALPQLTLGDGPSVVLCDPHARGAEQFRALRNTLALRWFKHPEGARTLAVVSPTEHEGQGAIAANLGIAFAQVGYQTLLIDADMGASSPHRSFNVGGNLGLAGYLAGAGGDVPLYGLDSIPNLAVIPLGDVPINPQDLLVGGIFQNLLNDARQRFEVILINTQPMSVAVDYLLIGADAEGVLIVTVNGQTRARDAEKLANDCREFGIRIVGAVMLDLA